MQLTAIQILTLVNAGISLIMGLYMLLLRQTATGNGTGFWASGSLVIGVGLLLRLIPPPDGYLSTTAPGMLISVGLYLYLAGIWKFKQRKLNYRIIIGFPLADLIQSLVFFFVFHSFRTLMVIHILFLSVYCVFAIAEMFRLPPGRSYLKTIFRINAFSFFIFFLLLMVNLAAVLTDETFNPNHVNDSGIVLHIISGFVMIALTFGFLSAVNMQLSNDLRNQLKSRNRFFSIIAHDLRGPVGNIMNFLDLLENEPELTERERKDFMKTIHTLSQSTYHLLLNLLEWGSKSKNLSNHEAEVLNLNQMVSENLSLFKSAAVLKSIDVEFNQGHGISLPGNKNMLKTVIRNLVSNAVKFTPENGRITISTNKTNDKIRLLITDTGRGMDQKTLQLLHRFREGHTTPGTNGEAGSGLGLVLCNEFVDFHNGTLRFESEPGRGTTALLEFPRNPNGSAARR